MHVLRFLLPALFAISWFLTRSFRDYAVRKNILDVATNRGMHTNPTPRGGGAAIFVTCTVGLIACWAMNIIPSSIAIGFLVGGSLVAAVGWLDDKGHVDAKKRAFTHLIASAIALYAFGGIDSLNFGVFKINTSAVCWIIALFVMVWMVNLYNFMDGIDGISSSEAITTSIIGFALIKSHASLPALPILLVIGASSLGFLLWNWNPAKIFMGDVGSGYLGFMFAAISCYCAIKSNTDVWICIVLLSVFIVDTTYTLLVRIKTGQKWSDPHNTHAFQQYAKLYGHRKVTQAVIAINCFWLAPMAAMIAQQPHLALVWVAIAVTPLVMMSWRIKSGFQV